MDDQELDRVLRDAYYDTGSPAFLAGGEAVYREALSLDARVTRRQVRDWLARQRTFTLYADSKKRFKRLQTVPSGLNTDWQADLNDMQKFAGQNDGHGYYLVCIDVLSRMTYAEPVKKKEHTYMKAAFDHIFRRAGTKPWKIYTDSGWEFESAQMRAYFSRKDILKFHSSAERELHATVAERANRTIKDRLYRFFSVENTLRWIDVLEDIVDDINNSVCRMTGMKPIDVNEVNGPVLQRRLYIRHTEYPVAKRPKFEVGDYVRVQVRKILFAKGWNKYTDKLFRVTAIEEDQGMNLYRLEDTLQRKLPGRFYERELVKAVHFSETTTRIAGVVRTAAGQPRRRRNPNGEGYQQLVRWVGHGPEFDSWVDENVLNVAHLPR